MSKKNLQPSLCACGSGFTYNSCCAKWHGGEYYLMAPSAEHLMRSRYTAYALNLEQYLLDTWHSQYRPNALNLEHTFTKYMHLNVIQHIILSDCSAQVAFNVKIKLNGKIHYMHELSFFVKENNMWFYTYGDQSA